MRLSNGNVVVALEADADSAAPVAWLSEFLAPAFRAGAGGAPDLTVALRPFAALPAAWAARATEPVTIRASSAQAFNLAGRAGETAGGRIVVDERCRTAYRFDGREDRVEVYWSEGSRIHLYELVRYTALLVEEARGTALVHASAAADETGCVLVAGDKGAGKTTTLLHLVADHGLRCFSGDKVLVTRHGDQARARGWPDYPHVGLGSFARFPALAAACGVALAGPDGAARPPTEKVLVDPARFRAAVRLAGGGPAPVRAVVLPNVRGPGRDVRVVPPEARRAERLAPYLEHPHEFGAVRWHGLLASLRRRARATHAATLAMLARARWIEVEGDAVVPAALLTA